MLPPLVICKGKGLYFSWFTEVDNQNAKFAHSDKGSMTDKLASSGYRPLAWWQKSVHSASHSFSLWTVIAPTTAWKWYDMQSKIISLWCPTLDIRLIFFNCLMYVSLHRCSVYTVKQSLNTSKRLILELPALFLGFFHSSTTRSIYCTKYQSSMAKSRGCTIQSRQCSQSVTSHHRPGRYHHHHHTKSTKSTCCTENTSKLARTTAVYFGCDNIQITKRHFITTQKRVKELHFSELTCASDWDCMDTIGVR